MPGPAPKRSEERRRRNKPDGVQLTKGEALPVQVPDPDPEWHPIARMIWDGIVTSGQAAYYQNSDYAFAYSICEDMSLYKSSGKRSSMMLASILGALSSLMLTEADRRRARIELSMPEPEEPALEAVAIETYRRQLGA